MIGYCKSKDCLRGYILGYFGQEHPEACGNCGVCNHEYVLSDITRESQMILSCAKRIYDKRGNWVGATILSRVLQGSREKVVLEQGLDQLTTYGLMRNFGRSQIRNIISHLSSEGYFAEDPDFQTLALTAKAGNVLYRGESVEMFSRKETEPVAQKPGTPESTLTGNAAELYEELRILRAEVAREEGVPAYVVFSNATLADMAKKMPKNSTELRRVSGVGEMKAKWYGTKFLKCIREFRTESKRQS